jgi:hypothetical protein
MVPTGRGKCRRGVPQINPHRPVLPAQIPAPAEAGGTPVGFPGDNPAFANRRDLAGPEKPAGAFLAAEGP